MHFIYEYQKEADVLNDMSEEDKLACVEENDEVEDSGDENYFSTVPIGNEATRETRAFPE